MCGDYNSVIGMNTENSLNRFLKKNSIKHFPAIGDATLCGVVAELSGPSGFFFKQKTAYEIGVRLVGSEMCIRDRTYAVS